MRMRLLMTICLLLLIPARVQAASQFSEAWQVCDPGESEPPGLDATLDPELLSNCVRYESSLPAGVNKTIWLKQRFPDVMENHQLLLIENGFEDVAIYVGGRLVYSYGQFNRDWGSVATQQWHALELDPAWAGQSLLIRTHFSYHFTNKPIIPVIMNHQEFRQSLQIKSIITAAMVGLLVMMGLVSASIAISALSFNVFAYFACLAFSGCAWVVLNQHSVIKKYLAIPYNLQTKMDLVSLFIGSACLMVCAGTLLDVQGRSYKLLTRPSWIWAGFGALFAFNPWLHSWYILPAYHILILLTMPLLLKVSAQKLWHGRTESKVFAVGSMAVFIGMFHDILQYAGLITTQHANASNFMIGLFFVFLTAALAIRYRRERLEAIALRDNLLRDVKSLNESLESHVRRVDALVDAKTRDIRSIMQHIEIGICLVDANSLEISPDYSHYTEKIFDRKKLSGVSVLRLLESFLKTDQTDRDHLEKALHTLRGGQREDFDFHEPSLPTRLVVTKSEHGSRDIDLSWHPICGDQGEIQRLLLTLTDVTIIRRLEKSAREKAKELAELNHYISEHVLQRFFPPDLVQDLMAGRASFDDKAREHLITVLIADLSNFTLATEVLGPELIANILNSYFVKMTDIVFSEGGTIDKFMGDGILVLFGAPREMPDHEQVQRACRCALKMQAALEELNASWDLRGLEPFKLRVAINHGTAIVGSFGGQKRSDYTAIGSTMNLAARISMSALQGEILLSASAAQFVEVEAVQSRGHFKLKGVSSECELFRYLPPAA
jgi:class 3 adenylate cyclase